MTDLHVFAVIEDPGVSRLLTRILRHVASLTVVHSVVTASAYLAAEGIAANVLIVDAELPDGSGIPVLLEARERHPSIRRVLLGAPMLAFAEHPTASEIAHAYIDKPFLPEDVVRMVVGR